MTGRKEPIIMFNLKHAAFLATIVTTLVAACTSPVGPQNSLVKTPSSWGRLTGATPTVDLNRPLATSPEAEVDHKWWKHLDDSTLDVQRASAQVSTTESLIPALQTAYDASAQPFECSFGISARQQGRFAQNHTRLEAAKSYHSYCGAGEGSGNASGYMRRRASLCGKRFRQICR